MLFDAKEARKFQTKIYKKKFLDYVELIIIVDEQFSLDNAIQF